MAEHDLHLKCMAGDLDAVKEQIAAGKELNYVEYDLTPLLAACQHGQPECALELLKAGADPNLGAMGKYPLTDSGFLYEDVVKALIEKGVNVDQTGYFETPALNLAMEKNKDEVAMHLIKAGANAKFVEPDGMTALMRAVWNDVPELAKALKDVSDRDYKLNDKTALEHAKESGKTEIVEILS
jgi:ankyrin repeat protein